MRSMQDTIIGAAGGLLVGCLLFAPGVNTPSSDVSSDSHTKPPAETAAHAVSAAQPSTSDEPNASAERETQTTPLDDALAGNPIDGADALPASPSGPVDLTDPRFIDALLAVAEDVDPELGKRLHGVCGDNPQAFTRLVKQAGRQLIGLTQLKLRDPELYKWKIAEMQWEPRAIELARDWHEAKALGKKQLAQELDEQLRGVVKIHLAMSFKARGEHILRLEQYIERLKQELDQDASRLPEHVEQRVKELKDRVAREMQGRNVTR